MSRCERSVGHLRLGAAEQRDVTALELRGHAVGRRAGGGERGDLGGVLALPQRTDDLDRAPERGRRQAREQVDQEAGPRLVADRRGAGPPGEVGHDRHRVLGLAPRAQREHPGLLDDARRLEPGDDERGVTVLRQHQHRQALEGHGQVARQVGQVVADGEEQHVDAPLRHQRADPLDAIEVDAGRSDGVGTHAPSLPVSPCRGNNDTVECQSEAACRTGTWNPRSRTSGASCRRTSASAGAVGTAPSSGSWTSSSPNPRPGRACSSWSTPSPRCAAART